MIKLPFGKKYIKVLVGLLAALFVINSVCFVDMNAFAAASPAVSVQIASAENGVAELENGAEGTAIVFLDCGDYIFKSGSIKLTLDSTLFTEVATKSDADIITKIDVSENLSIVKFSFDSAAGLKGMVQLGTVSFKLKEIDTTSVTSDIKLSEFKFVDNAGKTHSDDVSVNNISVKVENKNLVPSLPPSIAPDLQTQNPSATAGNDLQVQETPKPTNKTEILTDTAVYTIEDIEDLSNGAIVFWGLVFMVVGVWIGLGLGYWIWCKRKSKPQVKDTHSNVIGHLK